MGRDLIRSRLGKTIGNGKSTRVWRDPWLSLVSPNFTSGPATHGEEILSIRPSKLGVEDIYVWTPNEKGVYSTKTGYHVAMDIMKDKEDAAEVRTELPSEKVSNWNKEIWNLSSSPKMKLWLWKAARGALPIAANLICKNVIQSAHCCRW